MRREKLRSSALAFAFYVTTLHVSSAHVIASTLPRFTPHAIQHPRASVRLAASSTEIDKTINELLGEVKPEALPALLGRRLNVLTDPNFLTELETRRTAAEGGYEEAQLEQLSELVVTFLEEVAQRVKDLEPELAEVQAEADADIAKAAAAATTARKQTAAPPVRRAAPSAPAAPAAAATAAAATPPIAPSAAKGGDEAEAEKRERMAKNRFLLERLLDAAAVGTDRLDALLVEHRAKLSGDFFAHMQWEVEEQRKAKNRQLLSVLEVVVQRACVEVESGQPEVALLSSLLQTQNVNVRQELYQRSFIPAPPRVQQAFISLVTDTQLELEKKVFRGEMVDPSLLQQLRVVSVEANDLTSVDADTPAPKRYALDDEEMGI